MKPSWQSGSRRPLITTRRFDRRTLGNCWELSRRSLLQTLTDLSPRSCGGDCWTLKGDDTRSSSGHGGWASRPPCIRRSPNCLQIRSNQIASGGFAWIIRCFWTGILVTLLAKLSQHPKHRPMPRLPLLDELTYAKDWDLWLKAFYDERWPIRIVGTSSATAAIRQRGTESGVGRWDEQFLAPYLFTEYLELQNIPGKLRIEATLGETISRN